MLRAVCIDDEPLARERLRLLLKETDVEIVAECRNGREAIAFLQSEEVEVVFLDIQMPEVSGFDVIQAVGVNLLPPVIFTTAYQEHALQAFDVHAVDYLTKPIEPERLNFALNRVRKNLAADAAIAAQSRLGELLQERKAPGSESGQYLSRLLVRDGAKDVLLTVENISWIEAADYYCCLHAAGRRYMVREPIGVLERKLDPVNFLRVQRSAIVNLNEVKEIFREGPGESTMVLTNGTRLKMSKSGRQKLAEIGRV